MLAAHGGMIVFDDGSYEAVALELHEAVTSSSQHDPNAVAWWLVSRAAGIVALVLISVSVLTGLAMAAGALSRPKVKRFAMQLHELLALTSLAAIAVHGLALLGDHWLKPGLKRDRRARRDLPTARRSRPSGSSPGTSRCCSGRASTCAAGSARAAGASLHRAIVVVWVMGAAHTLGAGTDAPRLWLRAIALAPTVPVVYLLVLRLGPRRSSKTVRRGADERRPATGKRLAADVASAARARR